MSDIPGDLLERDHENALRETVARMCGLERANRYSFPLAWRELETKASLRLSRVPVSSLFTRVGMV